MKASYIKLLIVVSIAFLFGVLMVYNGHDFWGYMISFCIVILGISRHSKRCVSCQSWQTYTKSIAKYKDGAPNRIRKCDACSHTSPLYKKA